MKKMSDQHKVKADEESIALKKQVEEWKSKYIRALADYQNLEKRTNERVREVREFAAEIILGRLLSVVDTFGKVTEHINDPGLELAYKELVAVLVEQGVERMEVVGMPFDPTEMDCVEVIPGKDDEVIEEVLPGYKFRGKVLRVARVKVGKSEPTSN